MLRRACLKHHELLLLPLLHNEEVYLPLLALEGAHGGTFIPPLFPIVWAFH